MSNPVRFIDIMGMGSGESDACDNELEITRDYDQSFVESILYSIQYFFGVLEKPKAVAKEVADKVEEVVDAAEIVYENGKIIKEIGDATSPEQLSKSENAKELKYDITKQKEIALNNIPTVNKVNYAYLDTVAKKMMGNEKTIYKDKSWKYCEVIDSVTGKSSYVIKPID